MTAETEDVSTTGDSFRELVKSVGNRSLCIAGDSVSLQLYAAMMNEAKRYPKQFQIRQFPETKRDCRIKWWGCRNAMQKYQISWVGGSPMTVYWFKHYTYEPWDYEDMRDYCDILFYNLAHAHYSLRDGGRDNHPFVHDVELSLPRLAELAVASPRTPSSRPRLVAYYSSLAQHFSTTNGRYSKEYYGLPCHPQHISEDHENIVRCMLFNLQRRGISGPRVESMCKTSTAWNAYSLRLPTADNAQFKFQIPLDPLLSNQVQRALMSDAKYAEWDKEYREHRRRVNRSTIANKAGSVYYVPISHAFRSRSDAHVGKDCTHYCWQPFFWEPVWRTFAAVIVDHNGALSQNA